MPVQGYRRKYNKFGTHVKSRRSRDHNNQAAENAFSASWNFSETELEPSCITLILGKVLYGTTFWDWLHLH